MCESKKRQKNTSSGKNLISRKNCTHQRSESIGRIFKKWWESTREELLRKEERSLVELMKFHTFSANENVTTWAICTDWAFTVFIWDRFDRVIFDLGHFTTLFDTTIANKHVSRWTGLWFKFFNTFITNFDVTIRTIDFNFDTLSVDKDITIWTAEFGVVELLFWMEIIQINTFTVD